jgi:hypothetical protein
MPRPSRRERRRERSAAHPNRGRILLAVVLVAVVVLALSLRAIATFWTDLLWFDSLDLGSVWRKLLSAKVTLGIGATLVFFLLLWINLVVADRLAPRFRPMAGPEDEILVRYRELVAGRQRLVELGVALLIAIIPGLSASAQWREWLLFRYGGSFGVDDPQFGTDIGFFVFKLPFLSQIVDWLFGFLLVTAVVVAIVHYLNGAIRLQPMGERVTPNAKAHLSVILALAALVKAADYWLQRFELTVSSGRAFDGAGYTDVNARLPAIQLLILISLFVAVLLLVNIWRRGWVLPVIVVSLWLLVALVVGSAYPAFVQRFQVSPAELAKEREYIERNIEATRTALGLDDVQSSDFLYDPNLEQAEIDGQQANLDNARLLDPAVMQPTIQDLEFGREYYTFRDVDVDRYLVDQNGPPAVREPVIISTRELNSAGISSPTWEKLHLVFTHGYAAAVAPANKANGRGEPEFLISDIPARYSGLPELERPEIYHGEGMDGYAIVGTDQTELSTDQVTTSYEGDSGVGMASLPRRAAFALRFGEIEPLISGNLTDESRIIYRREITERVEAVAPFLSLDEDPYPVLVDGRIKYVIDGYTSSATYPYAQALDAAEVTNDQSGTFNYLRNSVKAVVDAYDGTVTLYLVDTLYGETDPIIRAYAKAFPGLFEAEVPESLSRHFRYPEMLFKTQTTIWGRYHQSDPASFFNNSDRWDVAQQPPDSSSAAAVRDDIELTQTGQQLERIEPYYQLLQLEPGAAPEFVLTRPFVLASQDDNGRSLTALMIAGNDPGSYGRLRQVVMSQPGSGPGEVERNNEVDAPLRANQKMVTYQPVSEYQSLVGRSGSRVQFGNFLILPFRNSLLFLRPIYAKQEQSGRFTLTRVVVSSGESVGFGDNVESALADLLDGNPDGAVDQPTAPSEPSEPDLPAGGSGAAAEGATPTELLALADQKFAEADQLLTNGDLGGYQDAVAAARSLIRQASEALGAPDGATATTAAPPEGTATGAAPTTDAEVGRT